MLAGATNDSLDKAQEKKTCVCLNALKCPINLKTEKTLLNQFASEVRLCDDTFQVEIPPMRQLQGHLKNIMHHTVSFVPISETTTPTNPSVFGLIKTQFNLSPAFEPHLCSRPLLAAVCCCWNGTHMLQRLPTVVTS